MARRVHSIQIQLLTKSKEGALNAVQTFNNPLATFKSEAFIVQVIIAWTYLLHAYYRKRGVDYRYSEVVNVRRRFHRTRAGAYKYWSLEDCLKHPDCPVDKPTKRNLFFLIGLRHEVEHQMCLGLDEQMSARYLACCLNYEAALTQLFGHKHSIAKYLVTSLQFSEMLLEPSDDVTPATLPAPIAQYIQKFDAGLDDDDFKSPKFAVRLIFTRKLANHRGQADNVIEFVAADSEIGTAINKQYVVLKDVEKPKLRAGEVVTLMKGEGHDRFRLHHHTNLWKAKDGKNPKKNYGVELGGQWFWYENWVDVVRKEVEKHPEMYGPPPNVGMTA